MSSRAFVVGIGSAIALSSCAAEYQQRQDRFRERYQADCRVLEAPAGSMPSALGLGPTTISEVIEGSTDKLQICYIEALQVWRQLEGRVVIQFTVEGNGEVTDPAVAMHYSSVFDPTVGCCMARVARTWKFPAPNDGKPFQVEYPFELITDVLKFRLSTPEATVPFKSKLAATVIVAPPLARGSADLHNVW